MNKERKVYTGGTFDLLHPGHIYLLKQCKMLAGEDGKVIVSLNRDDFIEEYKGRPPVMSYEERKTMLESCTFVDVVVENIGGEDSKPAILAVEPQILAIGVDWAVKDYYKQMQFDQDWLDEHGIVLVYLPHKEGLSSTNIKQRVREEG